MRTRWEKKTVKIKWLALCSALLAVCACVTNPPYQEMSDARQAVTAAVEGGAAEAEPYLVRLARRHMRNAQIAMKERRFNAARNEAMLAHRKASEALKKHQSNVP